MSRRSHGTGRPEVEIEKISEPAILKHGVYFYPRIATKSTVALGGVVLGGEPRRLAVGSKITLIEYMKSAGGSRFLAYAPQSHQDSSGRVHSAWYAWLFAEDWTSPRAQENPLTTGGKALIGAGIVGGVILAGIGVAYAMQASTAKKIAADRKLLDVKAEDKLRLEQSTTILPMSYYGTPVLQLYPKDDQKLVTAYVGDTVVLPPFEVASGSGFEWHVEAEQEGGGKAVNLEQLVTTSKLTRQGQAGPIDVVSSQFKVTEPGLYEYGAILEQRGATDWAAKYGVAIVVPPGARS